LQNKSGNHAVTWSQKLAPDFPSLKITKRILGSLPRTGKVKKNHWTSLKYYFAATKKLPGVSDLGERAEMLLQPLVNLSLGRRLAALKTIFFLQQNFLT
jgi:hypothetical protein